VLLLSGNRLRGLTSGIGHCQALQLVDLESNAYRHLPAPLGTLTQLRVRRGRGGRRAAVAPPAARPVPGALPAIGAARAGPRASKEANTR
jgi:hypothetical protein